MSPLFSTPLFLRRNRTVSLYISVAIALLFLFLLPTLVKSNEQHTLESAYTYLTRLDSYAFASRVNQTTHPLPTFENIGLTSESSSVLVEGTVDKRVEQVNLSLSEQDGHLLDGLGGLELRVEKGAVWARHPGQEWELLDPGQALDSTTNDPGAFLQAARNARISGVEEHLGEQFTLIAFDVDGGAWGEVMRQALQAEMTRRGELAPGTVLEELEFYKEMTGVGTLWVNESGLPQRLTLHLVYPPLPGESNYREVETTTDFSDWQGGDPLAWMMGTLRRILPTTPEEIATTLPILLLILFLTLFPLILVRYRENKGLYQTTMALLIVLFVINPLMNASVAYGAGIRRTSNNTERTETEGEEARLQAAVADIKAQFAAQFDVNRGAMATALDAAQLPVITAPGEVTLQAPQAQSATTDSDGDHIDDATEIARGLNPNNRDSDGDGLDDSTEDKLGVDPANPDSDGDLLSDGFEVVGISMGGKQWYLNPLNADTNDDGIQDSLECIQAIDVVVSPNGKGTKSAPKGDGTCADSDGDGTPDFADDDNDNDKVADWMDGQPESRLGDPTNGVPNRTFAFGVENYSSVNPLRVTFELRPTDPAHLWYSMNVLDWPSGDYEGQIQRVHDTRLGTTGAAANGDMQLVPMVEIVLPAGEATHLPTLANKIPINGDNGRLKEWLDMEVLQRYQMAVAWSQDGQSILVYLPAALIRDKHSNAPVNFVATMLYEPKGSGLFSRNHAARLVWMVQMDVDKCAVPEDSTYAESCYATGSNYQNGKYWQTTKNTMVQRYVENFYLTALTMEEDLSANGQIYYEDPARLATPSVDMPEQLLLFGTMLEQYAARATTPDQAFALYQRENPKFSNRLAAGTLLSNPEAYGLMAQIATKEAPRLLDAEFTPTGQSIAHPFLLYLTWGESKMAGLPGMVSNGTLRVDMSTGTKKSNITVRVGVFRYDQNPMTVADTLKNPNWSPVDPGKAWTDYLQGQSTQAFQQLSSDAKAHIGELVARGGRTVTGAPLSDSERESLAASEFQQTTLALYWNLANGITLNPDLLKASFVQASEASEFVGNLASAFDATGQSTIGAMTSTILDYREATKIAPPSATPAQTTTTAGATTPGAATGNPAELKIKIRNARVNSGIAGAGIGITGVVLILGVLTLLKDQIGLGAGAVRALEGVNASFGLLLSGVAIAAEVTKVVQTVSQATTTGLQALRGALSFTSTISTVGVVAAVVVVALVLVVSVVMFAKLLSDDNAVAAKSALAQGVATAIVVSVLFAIGLQFPVGTAIVLLIALIDGIITAVCKIGNWVGGEDAEGKTFEDRNKVFCGAIIGNITNALSVLFYGTLPMVDMSYKDRLTFGPTDTKVIESEYRLGMTAGNQLQISQPLTVTLRLPEEHTFTTWRDDERDAIRVGGGALTIIPYAEYTRVLKEKSVFKYELITDKSAPEWEYAWRTQAFLWESARTSEQAQERNWLRKTVNPTLQVPMTAGINWSAPSIYLREYYDYPVAECGIFAGLCDDEFEEFTEHLRDRQVITITQNLVYDIFPATLTDFYSLEQVRVNGETTNAYRLNWGGQTPFPELVDADGDGLRTDIDPDDKSADTDGDGLPDAVEVEDARLNPQRADSDNDNVSDYDEIRLGSRPDRADSDGDGLSDYDERAGWEFRYTDLAGAIRSAWVNSDPLIYDTDGDGYPDGEERVLVLNPRARDSDVRVLSLQTTTDQTQGIYLAPNQTLAFTSIVRNELLVPTAYGLLETEIIGTSQTTNPVPFRLQPRQSQPINGTVTVTAGSGEEIILQTRAGANMIDPTASYAAQLQGLAQADGLMFDLNFEALTNQQNFTDATGNNSVSCGQGSCPTIQSATSRLATFAGNTWFGVGAGATNPNGLSFSNPAFSAGGWVEIGREGVFASDTSDERVIFGPPDTVDNNARYLQLSLAELRSGTPKVKVSFTAKDGARCELILRELTVAYSQRTHIFVTYDGTLIHAYRNGEWVDSLNIGDRCIGKVPDGNRFTVGRGIDSTTIHVSELRIGDVDNEETADAYLHLNAEPQEFWFQTVGESDDTFTSVNVTLPPQTRRAKIYLCDLDGEITDNTVFREGCDNPDQGDDQMAVFRFNYYSQDDSQDSRADDRAWTENGAWSFPFDTRGEGNGEVRGSSYNNFFHGTLDDLRIYGRTLSDAEVTELARGDVLIYQLDEATGTKQFRNAGASAVALYCHPTDSCPQSGLPGYTGQAVHFTGEFDQYLNLRDLRRRVGSNLVAQFWFKPEAGNALGHSLLQYGNESEGFVLRADQSADRTGLFLEFTGNSAVTPSPFNIPVNQWSHIGVVQQGPSLRLYINGNSEQELTYQPGGGGAYELTGSYNLADFQMGDSIKGFVDDIAIGNGSGREVELAYHQRAFVHLPFDEATGATSFVNGTGQGNLNLTCPNPATCPQAGGDGRVRNGLFFNAPANFNWQRDRSERVAAMNLPEDMQDKPFSVAMWVNVPSAPTVNVQLLAVAPADGSIQFAWQLQLVSRDGKVLPEMVLRSSQAGGQCGGNLILKPLESATGQSLLTLAQGQWHHIAFTYDPGGSQHEFSWFLNGRKVPAVNFVNEGRTPEEGIVITDAKLPMAACNLGSVVQLGERYRGQMDEVYLYPIVLPDAEILSLYHYQSTWYDVVDTERFKVDATPPTVKLTTADHVKAGTTIFGIAVNDSEAGIRSVEYKDTNGMWQPARTETATSGVWTFGLNLTQSTTVEVRATDNVGNSQVDSKVVRVDNAPPQVTMASGGPRRDLTAQGTVQDAAGADDPNGSGVAAMQVQIILPNGDPLSPPRSVPIAENGTWQMSHELPMNVTGEFRIWVSAEDEVGNQFEGVVGTVKVDNEAPEITLVENPQKDPQGREVRAGIGQTIRGYAVATETTDLSKVEVGLLERRYKNDPARLQWLEAELVGGARWTLYLPEGLEGFYDVSLRATDTLGNIRTEPGVWHGIIDTKAPQVAVGGDVAGQQSCVVTDFNLGQTTFQCGNITNASAAASAFFTAGNFPEANFSWDTTWYRELFNGGTPEERLYSLHHTGADFNADNRVNSCDIYGNCSTCTIANGSTLSCTTSNIAPATSQSNGRGAGLMAPLEQGETEGDVLQVGVSYARVAYTRVNESAPPSARVTWEQLNDTHVLVDDAILPPTFPSAENYSLARTRIEWEAFNGATHYFVGWSNNESALPEELVPYNAPTRHQQQLPDRGRFYAHVIAMQNESELDSFTFGPIYFDGAPPPSYLNWEEFGSDHPYTLWQEATSSTAQQCNLLGVDNRVALSSNGTSARSGEQRFYGTWDEEWLALRWTGVNLEQMGDMHLYFDTREGGGIYAYDPYEPATEATSLVVMPERPHLQSEAGARMQADFALFVEDGSGMRLLQWGEGGWQEISATEVRFLAQEDGVDLWLPLALLGVDPGAVDVSLVGLVSEEESMAIWATMPGDNPLNSPEMLPNHLPLPITVEHTLVNLQGAMRLSANPDANHTLDNCPSNLHFDRALLDVTLIAEPGGEVYDPVVWDGVRSLVPDDVEEVLAALCVEASQPAPGTICDLAQHVANETGGEAPPKGPTGQWQATVGVGDEIVYHATVQNLSSQTTAPIQLQLRTNNLPLNTESLNVGVLAPFESRTIHFTGTVELEVEIELAAVQIIPIENLRSEKGDTFTYIHAPQIAFNFVDITAPTSATLDGRLLGALLGVGEHLLTGEIYDQSPVTEVVLTTSLGERFACQTTQRHDAFTSDWSCPITIAENTPDGTEVEIALSATDAYGQTSDTIAAWTFQVDTLAPRLTLLDGDGVEHNTVGSAVVTSDTLRLEGFVEDERLVNGVQMCASIEGYESCERAILNHYRESTGTESSSDRTHWYIEELMEYGIEGVTVPVTVSADDAVGNRTLLNFDTLIDTQAPLITVEDAPPVQVLAGYAFSTSGTVSDLSGVRSVMIQIEDPLGFINRYPATLANPNNSTSAWAFTLEAGQELFAIPGGYKVVLITTDSLGNTQLSQPYKVYVRIND